MYAVVQNVRRATLPAVMSVILTAFHHLWGHAHTFVEQPIGWMKNFPLKLNQGNTNDMHCPISLFKYVKAILFVLIYSIIFRMSKDAEKCRDYVYAL